MSDLVTDRFSDEEILLPDIDIRCAEHRGLLIERRKYLPQVPAMASYLVQAVKSRAAQVGYRDNPSGSLWLLYDRRKKNRTPLEELALRDVVHCVIEILGGE